MSTFDDFLDSVKDGAKDLAKNIFDDYQTEAQDDAEAFLEKTKVDLKRWSILLAQGELNQQDFGDLVLAKKALAEIHFLRQKGVALAKLERFRSGLVDLVVDTAVDTFL